jgi:hypothetical protein
MMEGVNTAVIYYKNVCKCHSVHQYSNNFKNVKTKKERQEKGWKCGLSSRVFAHSKP